MNRRLIIGIGILVVAIYLGFIGVHVSPFGSNADASGYLNHAKFIQKGITHAPLELLAEPQAGWFSYLQSPLGLTLDQTQSTIVPLYPVGYPLQLAAVGLIVSLPLATPVLNTLMVLLSGILMWIFARESELPTPWKIAAVAVLWASPLYIYNATQPMSDICALVWCLGALCAIQRGQRTERLRWYLVSGMCLAMAVLVRPTNALLVFVAMGLVGMKIRPLVSLAIGGTPGALFFLWYNNHLYGGPLKSGYGDVSRFLDWSFFTNGAVHFAQGVALLFSPIIPILFLGVFSLKPRLRNIILLWVIPVFIFYACYSFSDDNWWYLRFLLPVTPAIILGALAVAHKLIHLFDSRRTQLGLTALLFVGIVAWEVKTIPEQYTLVMKRGEVIYKQTADWARANMEPGAIIIAYQTSGALAYYNVDHFLVRSDLLTPADRDVMFETATAQNIPIYATMFLNENETVPLQVGGNWQQLAQFGVIKIYAVDPPTPAQLN